MTDLGMTPVAHIHNGIRSLEISFLLQTLGVLHDLFRLLFSGAENFVTIFKMLS